MSGRPHKIIGHVRVEIGEAELLWSCFEEDGCLCDPDTWETTVWMSTGRFEIGGWPLESMDDVELRRVAVAALVALAERAHDRGRSLSDVAAGASSRPRS